MEIFLVRFANFTIVPLLVAFIVLRLARGEITRSDRFELYLMYLFGLGVAGSGIGGFFGHIFLSDVVSESIGWPIGSPFQLEMGFANLALGVLGIVSVSRRDGFRLATIIAVAVVSVGASLVHFYDIFLTGNLAPGNTIQNAANILRPALLITFYVLWQRARGSMPQAAKELAASGWLAKNAHAVGWLTIAVATGFGVGFAFGEPALGSLAGLIAGLIAAWLILDLGNRRRAEVV